jgi:hypothetical protein
VTNPRDPVEPDDNDIDRWVEEMAGRRAPSNGATQVLRDVVASHSATENERLLGEAGSAEAQQRATDRLRQQLQSLREAEARPTTPDTPAVVRPAGAAAVNDRRWRLVAAFGVLVLVAGVVWQSLGTDDGDFKIADGGAAVWRDLEEPPRIATPQPAKAAQTLARQVAPFDARPALYREGNNILVDFDVAPARAKDLAAAITDPRIQAAVKPGLNRVIFVKQ